MLGEVEGCVEFDLDDPVGFRGVDGGGGGVEHVNGNDVFLKAGREEGAVG
jgi:hypothetical protein